MEYFNAFWTGGLICALVQILLDKTKLMPGRVMVLLVCSRALLGALGIYQPFQDFAGAGASVPLLGFGNVLWKGVKKAVDQNGLMAPFPVHHPDQVTHVFLYGNIQSDGGLVQKKHFRIVQKRGCKVCPHSLA